MGQGVGREESCWLVGLKMSEGEAIDSNGDAGCKTGRRIWQKEGKENNRPDWVTGRAANRNRQTDTLQVMASFSLVRSYSWKQETRACGLAGRLVSVRIGWLVRWDGWDSGFWPLSFPGSSQVPLPRLGRSPAPASLKVASAATKGEPPGEGAPPARPTFPPSTFSRPFLPFLIGGPIPAHCNRLPATSMQDLPLVQGECDK